MQNTLFRQESNKHCGGYIYGLPVHISYHFFYHMGHSYTEDRSNVLYRITRCHIPEYKLEITESSVCTLSEQV